MQLVKRYRNCTEITPAMLNEFIEKIIVHEATGEQGKNRSQQVDIYFNFIGQFSPVSKAERIFLPEKPKKDRTRIA